MHLEYATTWLERFWGTAETWQRSVLRMGNNFGTVPTPGPHPMPHAPIPPGRAVRKKRVSKKGRRLKAMAKAAARRAAMAPRVGFAARLGKANSLPGKMWEAWLTHVLQHAGPTKFLLLWLTAATCLRVTQIAQLKAEDFRFSAGAVLVRVAAFKGHEAIWKRALPSAARQLSQWREVGIPGRAARSNCRAGGRTAALQSFVWPSSGYLFPSRAGAAKPHVTKDVVSAMIRKIRPAFVQRFAGKWPELSDQSIRSHSGRRHAISWMVGEGVADLVGMTWAQIRTQRVYKGYTSLHQEQVGVLLARVDAEAPLAPEVPGTL